jgi:hypothetical protein
MKGSRIRVRAFLVGVFLAADLEASTVRTVNVNNDAMVPILLKLGKSTVLRFTEKPKKVVVGNQNYYGLEFIDNDVAIQPLGAVATNLFVYTDHHTFGFLLTPGERYDDLVFVRWKFLREERREKNTPLSSTKTTFPKISFLAGKTLRIGIEKIEGPSTFGLHIVDCKLENVGKSGVDLSNFKITGTRKGKALDAQKFVLEKDMLKPGESGKLRMLLRLGANEDFSIEVRLNSDSGKTVVGRKFL